MQKRAARTLVASLFALTLAALPGMSSAAEDKYTKSYGSGHSSLTSGKIAVMQCIVDKDISHNDLEKILPQLQDLRDAKFACDAEHDTILAEMLNEKSSNQKMSGDARLRDCETKLVDRRRDIWNTISEKIGSDKSDGLRRLVDPMTEDLSRVAYTNERIQRIDTLFMEWDKLAAARIAATGGTPVEVSGVRPASVETTVVTTTTTKRYGFPMIVTTPAVISEHDLVRLVEERIVAGEVGRSDTMILMPMNRDLTSADITFLREHKMKAWW